MPEYRKTKHLSEYKNSRFSWQQPMVYKLKTAEIYALNNIILHTRHYVTPLPYTSLPHR